MTHAKMKMTSPKKLRRRHKKILQHPNPKNEAILTKKNEGILTQKKKMTSLKNEDDPKNKLNYPTKN